MSTQPTFIELPSASMQGIYRKVQRLAGSDISFFITGETGVGKEGVAQYIHKSGPRRNEPFVAINCGRFSTEFLQSELFGHEKGAFTGANRQRQGAFERASGGILFLDEIAEMPLDAQAMLLRVLDAKTFTRLGGNENLTADFQLIAATNQNIGEAVLRTEFRSDLCYRLVGTMLDIPPLRERKKDIAPLVDAFIDEFSPQHADGVKGITPEALERLEAAVWPGNIRQLKATVQTAVAIAETDRLEIEDFPYNFFDVSGLERPVAPPEIESRTASSLELTQMLISAWNTLSPEARRTIKAELSEYFPDFWRNFGVPDVTLKDDTSELLDITDMNQHEILRAVAQSRIADYASLTEAARSLGIDVRTLQRHAHWQEAGNASDPV